MGRLWELALWLLIFAVAAAVVVGIVRSEAAVVTGRAAALDDLRLSEILAGPARDWDGDGVFNARQDEWLELENYGAAPVDLSAYRVADADSTIRFAFSGSLASGAVTLVTGRQAEDWQRSVGRTVTGLSLNNAGDTVILFRVGAADTTAVDVKAYNSIEGASDRSAGRLGADAVWTLFDGLNKYTGAGQPKGTGCLPTPGGINGCPTPVGSTTWGKIKTRFR
jgi:lamin tail-like protein